uniref:Uncharacterized protein n=1 Tax=Haptolina ericina TaxID=156174 RepID=A0A7S3FFJ0_9EUKA
MFRNVLLLCLVLLSTVQALVMQVVGGQLSARAAVGCQQSLGVCPCMGCRQNLKKEKRLRNRVNAFRFKKNDGFRRWTRPGQSTPEDLKKAEEDSAYFGLVFSYSAEAAAAEAQAAKEAPAASSA